jgi:hypothetical protein
VWRKLSKSVRHSGLWEELRATGSVEVIGERGPEEVGIQTFYNMPSHLKGGSYSSKVYVKRQQKNNLLCSSVQPHHFEVIGA